MDLKTFFVISKHLYSTRDTPPSAAIARHNKKSPGGEGGWGGFTHAKHRIVPNTIDVQAPFVFHCGLHQFKADAKMLRKGRSSTRKSVFYFVLALPPRHAPPIVTVTFLPQDTFFEHFLGNFFQNLIGN